MEENKEAIKEEQIEEEKPNFEEQVKELSDALAGLQFFSDQVRFNSVLYQGFNIILEKMTKIEENQMILLGKLTKLENNSNGNKV